MDKIDLVKKLKKDIQDIYSISDRFNDISEIHQIDVDLALSKVRNLYDLLLKLNPQENKKQVYTEKAVHKPIQEVTAKTPEPEIILPKETEVKEEIVPEPQTIVKEEIVKEKEVIAEPELIIEPTKKKEQKGNITEIPVKTVPEQKIHNGSSPEIVAEKFQSKRFVHDTISNKNSKPDVSSKLQSKPINDINSAIGLNDKFIFIRELFSGDKERYTETIQILNNFDNFENAIHFLNENFNWDKEDSNYERLIELVRRKYS